MDPTLTTAQAHQLFGELYRKSRPAELQAKVDKIVESTNDVFVRIKRIEDLDAGYDEERRRARQQEEAARGGGQSQRRGSAGGGAGRSSAKKRPATKQPQKSQRRRGGGGLFAWLFGGGGGNEISRWGEETKTLESGFFNVNPKLSPAVPAIFEGVVQEHISNCAKGFRFAAGGAWENMPPEKYNAIIAAYQFFSEFVKCGPTFRKSENPEVWITETIKMQKFYALLLQFPDYAQVITKELPEYLKKVPDAQPFAAAVKIAMDYVAGLEKRTPTLKNAIIALYVLARKRLVSWEDVTAELKIGKPALDNYRGPEQVMTRIQQRITDLKNKFENAQSELKEIEKIKNEYFDTDDNGRLRTDFLNPIVSQVVHRSYGENAITDNLLASFKREPHRLLFATLKDFDISYTNFLGGSVNVRTDGHHHEDVLIFKQGLFRAHLDKFNGVYRDAEAFMKKYRDISYSFADFMNELKKMPDDPIVRSFHNLVKHTNDLWSKINFDLQTVINNHKNAMERERLGKINDHIKQTRATPVESFEIEARFIPFADNRVITTDRLNDKTVSQVLEDMVRNMYNYLYIFRDAEMNRALNSGPTLIKRAAELKEKLGRLGVNTDDLPVG